MASRVVMPKLTDTMEEGLIIKWYKQEGDKVESGDVLAEIETDKAVMDLEAYASGVMRKILAPAEAKVPAGALIAVIAAVLGAIGVYWRRLYAFIRRTTGKASASGPDGPTDS